MGAPCEITGSGFTASHDCRHKCLSRTAIVCPDETKTSPKLCSGVSGCQPGECGDGEICYTVNDPFEQVSYCIPDTVCGLSSVGEKKAWEAFANQVATQTRLQQEIKEQRRKDGITRKQKCLHLRSQAYEV